jgi:hypothetical protein
MILCNKHYFFGEISALEKEYGLSAIVKLAPARQTAGINWCQLKE